jgi:hypothetical protein
MFFDELDRLMLEIVDFADFIIIFAKNKPNAKFEPTTLGSDFSIIIFSVLAVTATQLLVYAIVKY